MRILTVSKEQAQIFAAAIRPQIREYIENNREKYEAWLQAEYENECTDALPSAHLDKL